MSLTMGTAPLGHVPAGEWSAGFRVPDHLIWFEPSPRRVRGRFAGATVVDSARPYLLHESRHLPVWYFPRRDVRMELLEPTERSSRCPVKGEATYWSLRVGARVAENAAWAYPQPVAGSEFLADCVAFYFDVMDEWLEEDEQVFIHPRDPYHRIDVLASSRHIRVSVDGELVAESRGALALFEANLPTRWYLPREDVRMDRLRPESELTTSCPYKGRASYWSLDDHVAVAWTYEDPLAAVARVQDRVCFFNERVEIDVEVEGEIEETWNTPWTTGDWAITAVERSMKAAVGRVD